MVSTTIYTVFTYGNYLLIWVKTVNFIVFTNPNRRLSYRRDNCAWCGGRVDKNFYCFYEP